VRLNIKKKSSVRKTARQKNKVRIRRKIKGSNERPRLCVFRSGKHMYAQLIDDMSGRTLAAASSVKLDSAKSNCDTAKSVGAEVAKLGQEKNIKEVVFDRSGYLYHGRVKALAEGARDGGLSF